MSVYEQAASCCGVASDSSSFSTSYLCCCWHFLYLCSSFLALVECNHVSPLLFDQLVLSNLFCLFKNSHISAAVLMSTTLLLIFDSLLLLTHLIAEVSVSPHHVHFWSCDWDGCVTSSCTLFNICSHLVLYSSPQKSYCFFEFEVTIIAPSLVTLSLDNSC